MKRQGIGNSHPGRKQGTERLLALLRNALPPVEDEFAPSHDLWPAMERRLRQENVQRLLPVCVPWFDWALAGGLVFLLAAFPAWIPVLLYYL